MISINALSLLALSLPLAMACNPPPSTNETTNPFVTGSDGPADPETLGYTINHFSLISSDLEKTRCFYGDVLGMRHIYTFHASPNYTIMYMGHAQGGKNGTGFMTGEELLSEKDNMGGLIEFVNLKVIKTPILFNDSSLTCEQGSKTPPAYDPVRDPRQTFSHIGLIVPDINAAQARMEANNVTIVKRVGASVDLNGVIPPAFGVPDAAERDAAIPGVEKLGFLEFLIITDPDGNLLEVQPQI
jgi:lactoylglutathione lyase